MALSPIMPKLNALQLEVDQLKEDLDSKADLTGEINIEGELDTFPAEMSGVYEIVNI